MSEHHDISHELRRLAGVHATIAERWEDSEYHTAEMHWHVASVYEDAANALDAEGEL